MFNKEVLSDESLLNLRGSVWAGYNLEVDEKCEMFPVNVGRKYKINCKRYFAKITLKLSLTRQVIVVNCSECVCEWFALHANR